MSVSVLGLEARQTAKLYNNNKRCLCSKFNVIFERPRFREKAKKKSGSLIFLICHTSARTATNKYEKQEHRWVFGENRSQALKTKFYSV